jgi:hypothetical protein
MTDPAQPLKGCDCDYNSSQPSVVEALPPRVKTLAKIQDRFSTIEFFAIILSALLAVAVGSYIAINGGGGDSAKWSILFLWSSITIWAILWNVAVRIPEWVLRVAKDWPDDAATLAYRLNGVAAQLSLPIPEGLVSSEPKVAEALSRSRQKLTDQVELLAGRIEALDIVTNRITRRSWSKSMAQDLSSLRDDADKFAHSIEACQRLNAMTTASGREIARKVLLSQLP